jgi:hypothetical protein
MICRLIAFGFGYQRVVSTVAEGVKTSMIGWDDVAGVTNVAYSDENGLAVLRTY